MCSKVLNGHIILTDTSITTILAPEMTYTPNFGWEFYCNKMTGEGSYDTAGGTIFFPASGYRYYSTGAVHSVGSYGYFWSAVPNSTYNGRYLYFSSSSINPLNYNLRSYGFAVRPVQE